ncbi:MAG: flagellar hook-basal body complex protein FliE [Bdellovibrionaceae bacterium]|nr:flagellar hook-basal body complex protein FliE [Pseudobdellovibrionaceae bacterium]
MDGLSISNLKGVLEQGETLSELKKNKFNQEFEKLKAEQGFKTTSKSFSDTLNDAIGSVNQAQQKADRMMEDLATGKSKNIPEVMIATEKADIAMKLMMQVRNKVIDAYQEIMKMQV